MFALPQFSITLPLAAELRSRLSARLSALSLYLCISGLAVLFAFLPLLLPNQVSVWASPADMLWTRPGVWIAGLLSIAALASHLLQRRGHERAAALNFAGALLATATISAFQAARIDSIIFLPLIALAFASPHLRGRLALLGTACAAAVTVGMTLIVKDGLFSPTAAASILTSISIIVFLLLRQRRATEAASARLVEMVESLPTAVFRTAPNGMLLEANQAYQQLVRAPSRLALRRMPVGQFYADPAERADIMTSLIRDGSAAGVVRLRRLDDSLIWGRYQMRAAYDKAGILLHYEGTMEDVTAEHEAAEAQGRLAAVVSSASEAIITITESGKISSWNDAAERIFGHSAADMIGRPLRQVVPSAQRRGLDRLLKRAAAGQQIERFAVELQHASGTAIHTMTTMSPLQDRAGRIEGIAIIARDINTEYQLESRLARDARERAQIMDSLRGMAPKENATATAEMLCEAIATTDRFVNAYVLAFMPDDTTHVLASAQPEGAAVMAGHRLSDERSAELRKLAANGPWLEDASTKKNPLQAQVAAEQFLRWFAYAPLTLGDQLLGVLAVGVLPVENEEVVERLPVVAQLAGSVAAVLAPQLRDEFARAGIVAEVRQIIAERAFWPVFQPIIELASERVVGYEALTRFANNVRPDLMFARAAAANVGLELELATLRVALKAAEQLPAEVFVDFNASADLIVSGNELRDLLAASSVRATVEITEHTAVTDYTQLRQALAALGSHVPLAIDDAGAGYAGLRHILELRPDYLKLDRALVSGVDSDPSRQAMAAGMAHFARSTGARLIAEGVESWAEAASLIKIGVELGQGYAFGRPERVEHWCAGPDVQ